MSARETLLAAIVVAVGVALLAVPVIGAVGDPAPGSGGAAAIQTDGANDTTGGGDVSFGTRISAFMQATSANADSAVDTGMWAAKYDATNDTGRDEVVQARIDRLDRRSERLHERMDTLQASYENESIPRMAYVAQASQLTAKLEALGESVDHTAERARTTGVDTTRLDRIRTQARNLSGQEVATIAKNLSVVGPAQGGPPEDRGPDRSGRPTDVGPPSNETDSTRAGPPDGRGQGRSPQDDGEVAPPDAGDLPVNGSNRSTHGPPGSVGGAANGTSADGVTDGLDDATDAVSNTTDTLTNATDTVTNSTDEVSGTTDTLTNSTDTLTDATDTVTDSTDTLTGSTDTATDSTDGTDDTDGTSTDDTSGSLLGSVVRDGGGLLG